VDGYIEIIAIYLAMNKNRNTLWKNVITCQTMSSISLDDITNKMMQLDVGYSTWISAKNN